MNVIRFGYMILENEGLYDWKINMVEGDEGFCHKDSKTINFGQESENNFKLMIHEIAHCLTDAYHYSDEFERTVKILEEKYLK